MFPHFSGWQQEREPPHPSPPTPLIKLSNAYYKLHKSPCEMSWWINEQESRALKMERCSAVKGVLIECPQPPLQDCHHPLWTFSTLPAPAWAAESRSLCSAGGPLDRAHSCLIRVLLESPIPSVKYTDLHLGRLQQVQGSHLHLLVMWSTPGQNEGSLSPDCSHLVTIVTKEQFWFFFFFEASL